MTDQLFSYATHTFTASAPGKVILCGEYVVLEGYDCLVMGIDRRLFVTLEFFDSAVNSKRGLFIKSPGLIDEEVELVWEPSVCKWQCTHQPLLTFVTHAINSLHARDAHLAEYLNQGACLTVDSRMLFENKNKLGLGSSAAMVVALDEVFRQASIAFSAQSVGVLSHAQRWSYLHALHSVIQGKQGSGVDIAASLQGGISQFKNIYHHTCELTPYVLPDGLYITFFWSGVSASTPQYLTSLSTWKTDSPHMYKSMVQTLGEYANLLSHQKEGDRFIQTLQCFTDALYAFAQESGVPIFGGGHNKLYHLAHLFPQLVYKPCGAGGGDLGIAVTNDSATRDMFIQQARVHDFVPVALEIDPLGVS